jgi:hypothetical protein
MSSVRATLATARVCLERSFTTEYPVVKEILRRKADRLIVAASVGLESMPQSWADAIEHQRQNGPSKEPVMVAEFPTMTRADFLAWRKDQAKK